MGQINPAAARLEAILTLLFGAADQHDLAQAREHALAIAELDDEEVGAIASDAPAGPLQHVRRGDFLRGFRADDPLDFARHRVPASHVIGETRKGGQWVQAQTLAQFYAEFFTDLTEAGSPPSDEQVQTTTEELEESGWTLDRDARGVWIASPIEDIEDTKGPVQLARSGWRLDYAAQRSPKGGISIQGKHYPGGQFIPASVVASAAPEEKAALEKTKKAGEEKSKQKADERRARGPVSKEALISRLDPAVSKHGLPRHDLWTAKLSWNALKRHHGDLALHRVEELADQAELAYNKIDPDDEKKEGLRNRLGKKLAVLRRMVDLAERDEEASREQQEAQRPVEERSPHLKLVDALAARLDRGEQITSADLRAEAALAYGGTMAEGRYGYSEATDALEAALNKTFLGKTDPTTDLADATHQVQGIAEKVSQLPTQTNRSGEKETHQQFSTPPHYAFAVAWLANLTPNDVVLEPSAGTGCIAIQASNTGADVHVNELSRRRASFLGDLLGADHVHVEDAEQIAGILPGQGLPQPTAIVMNPPFSQTAGRMGDRKELLTGARHIDEALRLLAPGGRLVAVVGRGMSPDSATYRAWFAKLRAKYGLRANVVVSGKEYTKYGTQFDTRVLIIDKTGPDAGDPIIGEAHDVLGLMSMLEGVRNDRPEATRQPSGKPAGAAMPGSDTGVGQSPDDAAGATGAGAPGESASAGTDAGPGGPEGAGGIPGMPAEPADGGGDAGGGLPGTAKRPRRKRGSGVAGAEGTPGSTGEGDAGGQDGPRGGKGARGKSLRQPAARLPQLRPPERLKIGVAAADEPGGAPSAPEPPSPGFTGWDALGREWINGELVPAKDEPGSQKGMGPSLYESYRPKLLRVEGAKTHTTPLVESSAMSAVTPPSPTYQPMLSPDIIEKGILSEAQLESVVYAGQAHETMLPTTGTAMGDGMVLLAPTGESHALKRDPASGTWSLTGTPHTFKTEDEAREFLASAGFKDHKGSVISSATAVRKGFFIGDGTGVGKGRQIAGVISDNVNQGRKKHVWVSQKQNLIEDARRDWTALGQDDGDLHHFDKIRKSAKPPTEGVAFITYDTLKGKPKDPAAKSNLDQLAEWLGSDFDGVIALDEAHGLANSISIKGARGDKDASQKAQAGIELQKRFPKARVLYVSATGATEVSNLAYAERLGLWGRGTPFPDKINFIDQMNKGGVAAMEAVAQSLKAMGGYNARSLSFDDGTLEGRVTYDRVTHHLTPDQRGMYDAAADGWQVVLQNIDKALEATGGSEDKNARSAAKSQFWGAQQRFFNQVMTTMQTPSVITAMKQDIAEGRSPVVQLVNTSEAALKRALSDREDDDAIEDMDLSPKQILMQYLEKSFPVNRMEEYATEGGGTAMRPVLDSNGAPVIDPEAAAIRDEMMAMTNMLRIPESPLDMIINHFGVENVAEATGRTQRVVQREQEDGSIKPVLERRDSSSGSSADASDFQAGRKKVLIFSDAGGTGRSYHADKNAANQQQRVHYMLQPGWRADNAVQGLGRTHRTNQAVAPTYRLVEIEDLKSQKRFISTIARRLDQLGALTKGQRQAGGGGLFSSADNLEGPQAAQAMASFFRDLQAGQIEGLEYDDIITKLGLKKPEKPGKRRGQQEAPPVPDSMGQFLNRLLSLRVDMQASVFEAFDKRLKQKVDQAIREGTLDTGVENYPAESIAKKTDNVVFREPSSGAEVRHVVTSVKRKTDKTTFDKQLEGEKPLGFVKDDESGKIYAYYRTADKTNAETGKVISQMRIEGPAGDRKYRPAHEFERYSTKFTTVDQATARQQWDEEYAELPDFHEAEEHFLTGALLPVWDRIPGEKPKIYRLKTDDGKTVVGRHVGRKQVPTMLKNLGISHEGAKHTTEGVHQKLSGGRATGATLANGWRLKPVRVQNEKRIELTGGKSYGQDIGPAAMQELKADGVIVERINWTNRFFIPTGAEGAKVLERVTRSRPIADVDEPDDAMGAPVSSKEKASTVASAVSPAPSPAAPAAAIATPPPPAPISTKKVSTARGERHVHSFSPSPAFWDARKKGKLPSSVSVRKNDNTGQWEASIWGETPGEVQKVADGLRAMGVYRFARSGQALQYARLAQDALRRGDWASHAIYARQAQEAAQRPSQRRQRNPLALQYARLSQDAARRGDHASAVIYERQRLALEG